MTSIDDNAIHTVMFLVQFGTHAITTRICVGLEQSTEANTCVEGSLSMIVSKVVCCPCHDKCVAIADFGFLTFSLVACLTKT